MELSVFLPKIYDILGEFLTVLEYDYQIGNEISYLAVYVVATVMSK